MRILSIETSCDETALSLIETVDMTEGAKNMSTNMPTFEVLGNALFSQIETHKEYGGVFPMMAKREHIKNIVPLFCALMKISIEKVAGRDKHQDDENQDTKDRDAKKYKIFSPSVTPETKAQVSKLLEREIGLADAIFEIFSPSTLILDFDYIAVTAGPGLEPALWVGINFAKALSLILKKPIVPVNHMEGHIVSVLIGGDNRDDNCSDKNSAKDEQEEVATGVISPTVEFPALALLISGGHTELVLAKDWHDYKILGQTVDDAIGEAFDKVARLLDLPYPGGPKISMLAQKSREENLAEKLAGVIPTDKTFADKKPWTLPRPMIKSGDYNFSFSGIKTAVLYAVKKKLASQSQSDTQSAAQTSLTEDEKATLAEEFENAVTEVLVSKTARALEETGAKTLIIGGGVVANKYIRQNFERIIADKFSSDAQNVKLFVPSIDMSTDNSVMIAVAGALLLSNKNTRVIQPVDVPNIDNLRASGNMSL